MAILFFALLISLIPLVIDTLLKLRRIVRMMIYKWRLRKAKAKKTSSVNLDDTQRAPIVKKKDSLE